MKDNRRISETNEKGFYAVLKSHTHAYSSEEMKRLIGSMSMDRIAKTADVLARYIRDNFPKAITRRPGLQGYRINPYVVMASACTRSLTNSDFSDFAKFIVDNKLYMGYETSFGKSIEQIMVSQYPTHQNTIRWIDPPEKVVERNGLIGISREERAKRRNSSIWREIDKSCIIGNRRYLISIKSGPNTINDTQVQAMKTAIATQYSVWMNQSKITYPQVTELDVVLGITYGTERTTNNKDNQILVKLLENGFKEEDRQNKPGILIDGSTRSIRVYRLVGQDFWAFIGDPTNPENNRFIYLEVLFALSKALTNALSKGTEPDTLENKVNRNIAGLTLALARIALPDGTFPSYIKENFSEDQLSWITVAMTSFFDSGI